ncbi:MAG TPA: hypothetical protein VHS96_08285 [Bacteroidia bacterium]|nr:hypothetical protein [Bacteroidia bacterium]
MILLRPNQQRNMWKKSLWEQIEDKERECFQVLQYQQTLISKSKRLRKDFVNLNGSAGQSVAFFLLCIQTGAKARQKVRFWQPSPCAMGHFF